MSNSFEDTVKRAYALAAAHRHEFVTLEHLLFALTDNEEVQSLIHAVGGDIKKLIADLKLYIDEPSNHVLVKSGTYQPRHTALLLTIVKKAKTQSLFSGRNDMGCMDLFLAMFNIENSYASYFLHDAGLDKDNILDFLSNNNKPVTSTNQTSALDLLSQYCVNLNEKARDGKIDPLIGREKEVETITQVMARRNKHNVLMLGDPGTGKTVLIEGLAKRIVEGDVPETLIDKVIWSLDISSIVAGTKFRGDFEDRMKNIIAALTSLPNAIVFIDEIHMIMGAGSGSSGTMDAANILKPALGRGEICCIGSTTQEEYRKHFEKDRAMMRRFQRVDIDEPSIEDSKRILLGLSQYYTQYHGISYTPAALDAAVELSSRYMHDKCLPDKAIDIMDSAGARQKVKPLHERVEIIDVAEITEEVMRIAKVVISNSIGTENEDIADLERKLQSAVFGQDEAVTKLTDAVYISRSGLREGNKTLGAFLFTGPSGVGKCLAGDQQVKIRVTKEFASVLLSLSSQRSV